MKEVTEQGAFLQLAQLCARSEHCQYELLEKMRRWGMTDEAQARVMQRLMSERYVDDERYARAFARDKSALQGWGNRKITLALQRKGISAADIAAALAEIDAAAAAARCEQVLVAKWKTLQRETDPARREAKFFRYALGRGYGYEEIKRIYDHLRRDKDS